nr:LLM class flavin-dependent oxidoreductase [Kineococcus aurantiacus]
MPGARGRADDVDWIVHTAQLAERARFDLFFCEDALTAPRPGHDGPVRAVEPLTLLAAVARGTRHLGLVATASTTFSEPCDLARQFASLDRISHGRAGWNAVTSQFADVVANFGPARFPDHATRYLRAAEFVDVVCTVAQDPTEGRGFRERVHAAARVHGREPEQVLVFPGVLPVVAATRAAAQEVWA